MEPMFNQRAPSPPPESTPPSNNRRSEFHADTTQEDTLHSSRRTIHRQVDEVVPHRVDLLPGGSPWTTSIELDQHKEAASNYAKQWQQLAVKYEDLSQEPGQPDVAPLRNWAETGLPNILLDWLEDGLGLEQPTTVQRACIPVLLQGHHCIGVAETGSGKTLAYLVPLVRYLVRQWGHVHGSRPSPVAVVITPTRELAIQVYTVTRELLRRLDWPAARSTKADSTHWNQNGHRKRCAVDMCLCAYGGADLAANVAALCRGVAVLVGTPGRVISLLQMNKGRLLRLQDTALLVLDEVDRLLDMGFAPQIRRILQGTPSNVQMALFSATLPLVMERLVRKLVRQRSPTSSVRRLVLIRCGTLSGTPTVPRAIDQRLEVLSTPSTGAAADAAAAAADDDDAARFAALLDILRWHSAARILVFVSRQEQVDLLFQRLDEWYRGTQQRCQSKVGEASSKTPYAAIEQMLALHGGIDQTDRDDTWQSFRGSPEEIKFGDSTCRLLIATSLAARGLDVPDLGVVVNYHPPRSLEDYVHRVGRTGRANRAGVAYTLFMPKRDDHAAPLLRTCLEAANKVVPEALLEACQRLMLTTQCRQRPQHAVTTDDAKTNAVRAADSDAVKARCPPVATGNTSTPIPEGTACAEAIPTKASVAAGARDSVANATRASSDKDQKLGASSPVASTLDSIESASETGSNAKDSSLMRGAFVEATGHHRRYRLAWPSGYDGRGFAFDERDRERQQRRLLLAALDEAEEDLPRERLPPQRPIDPKVNPPEGPIVSAESTTAMISVNDYPAAVRLRVTSSAFLSRILDRHGCRVLVKGTFQRQRIDTAKASLAMSEAERPLYLSLEAPTPTALQAAFQEINREIDERQQLAGASSGYKRYRVPSGL
ncbi:hypothetical protein CCYA_CCYA07G2009 [Cyanidiococcus yangmingshanensis]|nr:hypothetical protein CCYA_CCYA07G2009 [Cyanidiococcus yangmingshanensis]